MAEKFNLDYILKEAEAGSEIMQCMAGDCYFRGLFCEIDYEKAVYWFEKASEQGNHEAQAKLGECYLKGLGVEKDTQKAIEILEEAALWWDGGDAVITLAYAYYEGSYGVKKDWEEALVYFRLMDERALYNDEYDELRAWKAEKDLKEREDPKIMNALADQYFFGIGVGQDTERALKLYERAYELGYIPAMRDAGSNFLRCDREETFSPEKAVFWFERAGNAGDVESMLKAAGLYEDGYGIPKNPQKAFEWYERAAGKGSAHGLIGLARYYKGGVVVEKDVKKAFKLLSRASKGRHGEDALYPLGEMYEYGQGVNADQEKAFKCYSDSYGRMSLKYGKYACYKMGVMYCDGRGTDKNDELAKKFLRIAASCRLECAKAKLKEYFGEDS